MLNKLEVKSLYIRGYNAVQISNILNASKESVRKCIQRNFKEFKISHDAARLADKEIDRVTRFEAKKYISDASFIKKNRSIFKTLPNGDVVLDKEKAGAVSFDTPRRITNEFSLDRVNKNINNAGYKKEELFQ